MGWKERMKEFGGGAVDFLTEDGEAIMFLVVGEPQLLKGTFKQQETERIGAPVVTIEGVSVLVLGKRIARRLSKHESIFKTTPFIITRHGGPGDTNATYELNVVTNEAHTDKLIKIRDAANLKADIKQAFEDVKAIVEK